MSTVAVVDGSPVMGDRIHRKLGEGVEQYQFTRGRDLVVSALVKPAAKL